MEKERELELFSRRFSKPYDIQQFLNETPYNDKKICKSPYNVMKERTAHCAEGAYFAAAMLQFMGHEPLVLDFFAVNDDDHIIALYKHKGYWGAIAKSNTTVLRFREPVYKNLRELSMSYFEMYFNTIGEKTLRSYSKPVSLRRFDKKEWMTTGEDIEFIGDYLTAARHYPLVDKEQTAMLSPVDEDLLKTCFAVANPDGLYKPE